MPERLYLHLPDQQLAELWEAHRLSEADRQAAEIHAVKLVAVAHAKDWSPEDRAVLRYGAILDWLGINRPAATLEGLTAEIFQRTAALQGRTRQLAEWVDRVETGHGEPAERETLQGILERIAALDSAR